MSVGACAKERRQFRGAQPSIFLDHGLERSFGGSVQQRWTSSSTWWGGMTSFSEALQNSRDSGVRAFYLCSDFAIGRLEWPLAWPYRIAPRFFGVSSFLRAMRGWGQRFGGWPLF